MKIFLNYLTAVLFLSLVVFASCGGSDDGGEEGKSDLELALENLTGNGTATVSTVNTDGQTELEWEVDPKFTIDFTGTVDGGSYTTSNSKNTDVWPVSGTWTFTDATGTKITRNDGVEVSLTLSTTDLIMTFEYVSPVPARTMVIDGDWVFNMKYAVTVQ